MFKNNLPSLTIFLGSFLIFGVQPMLGRTLLPSFGGTAAVWTTCLATYQVLLLVGYWYAHVATGRGRARVSDPAEARSESVALPRDVASGSRRNARRTTFHVGLLGLAVAWVMAFAYCRPWLMSYVGNGAYPALDVLLCVLAFAGLPYVLLSANSTLIQAWLSQSNNAIRQSGNQAMSSDVYRLYAVSNAGSLLGLLCYPFLIEPFLSLNVQWYGFAFALGAYAVLLALLARRIALLPDCHIALLKESQQSGGRSDRPLDGDPPSLPGGAARSENVALPTLGNNAITQSGNKAILWLVLPATSTFLLNAVTAHLSTDVTPIPLLWVVLLAAFLLSYIIGFSRIGEKGVWVWCVAGMIPLVYCAYASGLKGGNGFIFNLIPGILFMLLGCTFLHSWLYSIRPEAERLTRYYLCLAAGGAIGGLLSGLVAPLIFTSVVEYPYALVTVALFSALYAWMNTTQWFHFIRVVGQLTVLAVIYFLCDGQFSDQADQTAMRHSRNFYGCLTVSNREMQDEFDFPVLTRRLHHGQTLHGVQYQSSDLRESPTTYYGAAGGGFAILSHPAYTNGTPLRIGLIGLGVGTMACWGRTNDTYRFFEINPQVIKIASDTNTFTYLSDSKANISIALGDARKVIAAETNRYDVLVIDAYSGDAIPFHLATQEAFRLYLDRLNPGGILAMHITNWHLDLNPLCKAVAKEWGLQLTGIISEEEGLSFGATWVFICDRPLPVQTGESVHELDWTQVRDIALPTDACGSLINLVRYRHHPPEKPQVVKLLSD